MVKNIGLRFIGRFATEGSSIVMNMVSGNIAGVAIHVCCQTIGLIDSVIKYSGESKRNKEIKKQIRHQKNVLDMGVEYIEEAVNEKLELLKEQLHEKYLRKKLYLNNELEKYKREVAVIGVSVNNDFKEQKKIQQMTNKLCGQLNNILDDIELRINEIDKEEKDKTTIYILQEDYRLVQQQIVKLLNK